jgi:hypothetical protein
VEQETLMTEEERELYDKILEVSDYFKYNIVEEFSDELKKHCSVIDAQKKYISETFNFDLLQTGLKTLPHHYLLELNNNFSAFQEINNQLFQINEEFLKSDKKVFSQEDITKIKQLENQHSEKFFEFKNLAVLILPFIKVSNNLFDFQISELNKNNEKAQKLISELRTTSEEVSVGKHADIFEKASINYNKVSSSWFWALTAVILLGSVGIVLYFINFKTILDSIPKEKVIVFSISKLFVISFYYLLITFCLKNYLTNRHNFIVNSHRHNALSTLRTFNNSTKDEETKRIILLQIASTIFSHQSSGYLKTSSEKLSSFNFIEYLKPIIKS